MGLQYTRWLHGKAAWACFCSSPGERRRASVCLCVSYNYDCVGGLFWYASACFSTQVLSPDVKGLDYYHCEQRKSWRHDSYVCRMALPPTKGSVHSSARGQTYAQGRGRNAPSVTSDTPTSAPPQSGRHFFCRTYSRSNLICGLLRWR